ncbi:MAG: SPOR domain-containing protein [Thermoanaerobaculia bacterium]
MSEPHEPSYYEIALTNRQVVVAFVILLTCLLAAFFSGIWIGRESTARAAQEAMVRNTPPEAAQEGKNLEELEFFDSKGKKGKNGKRQEAAATPGGTLLEDVGGKKTAAQTPPPAPAEPVQEEPAPAAAQTPQETAPVPTTLPDPAQERRNRRKARNAAAEAAAAATPAPAAPEPAPAPARAAKTARRAAAPAIPKGSYVIQVFSSPDQAQAERIRGQLAGGGQKAYLSPIDRGGRTMYRVRIGPFKSRADAQGVADKVRKGYKLDTWVTE